MKPPRKQTSVIVRSGACTRRKHGSLDPPDLGVDATDTPRSTESDAVMNPSSSEAKDLIALAERMGIPTQAAVRAVLQHLTDRDEPEDVIEPHPMVGRMSA